MTKDLEPRPISPKFLQPGQNFFDQNGIKEVVQGIMKGTRYQPKLVRTALSRIAKATFESEVEGFDANSNPVVAQLPANLQMSRVRSISEHPDIIEYLSTMDREFYTTGGEFKMTESKFLAPETYEEWRRKKDERSVRISALKEEASTENERIPWRSASSSRGFRRNPLTAQFVRPDDLYR